MNSKTKILATLGPASGDKKVLKEMIERGVDAIRLNFSWGTHEEHAEYVKNVREVAAEVGKKILIVQDLSGPREQTGKDHGFSEAAIEIITPKDLADLRFGIEQGVDYVAMSYVGSASDVHKIREEANKIESSGKPKIIAKIERKVALDNLDQIIEASDAIMIARGDLGNEIPLEQIPFVEIDIIKQCRAMNKPVIVATEMMPSMVESPIPKRADVTDVAFAVMHGASATMFSEETAKGKYPVEAVTMMKRVIIEAEKHREDMEITPL